MANCVLRETTNFKVPYSPRSRHIPIKRIAPCPSSDHIIAQPKRSRLVYTPASASRTSSALSVRNSNCITINTNKTARSIAWESTSCFQSYCNVGMLTLQSGAPQRSEVAMKGLRYDPINSSNTKQVSTKGFSGNSESKQSGCCPLRMSSTGYSTPPYSSNSPALNRGGKKSRRRPLSQRLKRRSADCKKSNHSNRVESNPDKENKHSGANAIAVYHSFLKKQEDAMRSENKSDPRTISTALVSTMSGSVKSVDTSVRYSTNFSPQMTSTPQRPRSKTVCARSSTGSEFKRPLTPHSKESKKDNTLTDVLKALEDEQKMGASHIMLPLAELTDMVKDMHRRQEAADENNETSSVGSTDTSASNNNEAEMFSKVKPTIPRTTLPGMYPIGAPRAASSPVPECRKSEYGVPGENFLNNRGRRVRRRHLAGDYSAFSIGIATGAGDRNVWRPW